VLVGALDEGWDRDGGGGGGGGAIDADEAAMLLGDVCDVLHDRFGDGDGAASEGGLVLAAAPAAAAAVARRCRAAGDPTPAKTPARGKKRGASAAAAAEAATKAVPARRRWALLRALRHCVDRKGAREATRDALVWALDVMEGTRDGAAGERGYAAGGFEDAAAVAAAAMAARASFGPEEDGSEAGDAGDAEDAAEDAAYARRAATAARDCPGVLDAAAALLSGAGASAASGPGDALDDALRTHLPSLQSPSRHLRAATLRYLRAVAEAEAGEAIDLDGVPANQTPATVGEMLVRWLEINARDAHEAAGDVLEFAKRSQVALAAMRRGAGGDDGDVEVAAPGPSRGRRGAYAGLGSGGAGYGSLAAAASGAPGRRPGGWAGGGASREGSWWSAL
jgi:U3 small nucleolar RNA-associated protein 20